MQLLTSPNHAARMRGNPKIMQMLEIHTSPVTLR